MSTHTDNKKKRYKVECKSKESHFAVCCYEDRLEFWKTICALDALDTGGKCFYRQFPLTNSKKIYFTINECKNGGMKNGKGND